MGTHPIFESDFDCLTDQATGMSIRQRKAPSNDLAGDIKSAADDQTSGQESQNDSKNSLQSPDVSVIKNESMFQIALEMLFPFILAGIGMVLAGLLFDHVQHWDVFDSIHELFILIPPLLGLKG